MIAPLSGTISMEAVAAAPSTHACPACAAPRALLLGFAIHAGATLTLIPTLACPACQTISPS